MKKTFMRLTVLALLLAVVQGAWAQTDVSTEQALKEAVNGNKSVKLTADISLGSRLVIANGKSVTIDLNGHKLSRSLKSAAGDGNVISVETGGQLTVKDSGNDYGQISGGKAINGGGICNHGTLTLEGGTVTDCYASSNGGGIYNAPATAGGTPATLAIKGGQVTTNSCGDRGAGIFNYSGCTLNMQGKVFIAENLKNSQQNNVYLGGESVITVTGALTGSHIGVSIAQTFRNITSGYKAKNPSVDGSTFFRSDNSQIGIVQNGDEVAIGRSAVAYSVRSWNETSKQVETTSSNCFGYTLLEGSHPNDWVGLSDGYYVVKGTVEYKALSITGSEVHLVLCDGATLRCAHVKQEEGHTLHIHSQSDGNLQGKLEVMNRTKDDAYIFKNAAAIGGGNEQSMGNLFIHGGKVTAYGGENGAGIGGGRRGNQGGSVIIYGGNVEAEGGIDAAGIGGGDNYGKGGNGGVVKIYGGHVVAIGGKTDDTEIACSGAGIGAGRDSNGGQVYIYGGEVYAYGGKQAAGVGGSGSGKGGTLEVNGGYLFAAGVYEAPAIGGGSNGAGGTVIINGGTVCAAKGGRYVKIIGGYYRYDSGLLKLASGMRVLCGNADDAVSNPAHREKSHLTPVEFENQRREVCQSHSYTCVLIEPCNHTAPNGDKLDKIAPIDEFTHSISCRYCVDNAVEEHQLPTASSSKCDACGREAKDICYYLHDNDKKTPERISAMSSGSQWNVMLKDHTFYHDGNWNTVVLPFELASFAGTPLEGATVERVKEATLSADGVLTISLEEVKAILNADGTVGQPLFVKWPKGDDVTGPRFNSVTLSSKEKPYTFAGGSFQPLYKPLNITRENLDNIVFLSSDNRLGYSMWLRQLRAFHGYFHFDTVAGARAMNRAIINHGDGTTSVITPKDGRPITVDEFWYDLLGRRLDGQPTEKGLYIHKGKK